MGTLRQTVSEIVQTMEALAEGVIEDLSTEASGRRAGIDPGTLEPIGPPSEVAPVRFA